MLLDNVSLLMLINICDSHKKVILLSNKYKDCEINFENKILSFQGFKDAVTSAKAETLLNLADKANQKSVDYEHQLYIRKDVQWLYEEDNEWKPFPLYLDALIESAHSRNMPHVRVDSIIQPVI